MRLIFAFALAVISTSAFADPPPKSETRAVIHNAQHSGPCQCRAMGRMYNMGEQVCLDLGNGRRAYNCDMDQNVTSWKNTGRGCPES